MIQKLIWLLSLCLSLQLSHAQSIGINTDGSAPNASAILDVKSTSKGILIPRMSLEQRDLINDPVEGLMIYQSDNLPGLYMFSGTNWTILTTPSQVWGTTGNSGTDPNTQFIGTIDNNSLRFRVDNTWAGELNRIARNVTFGDSSGVSITTGQDNVGLGHKSLRLLSTGFRNNAIGAYALNSTPNGNNNNAMGYHALYSNTTGGDNTAIGTLAMEKNTVGVHNIAIGPAALYNSTTGSINIGIGPFALYNNTNGSTNIGVGLDALYDNTTGQNNLAAGISALSNNTSGSHNVSIGTSALNENVTGNHNISIGVDSGTNGSYDNTVSIGNHGWDNEYHNQVFLGNQSTIFIGGWVNWTNYSDARIKKDIREDVKGLEFITRLRPVTYHRDIDLAVQLTENQPTENYPHKYDVEQIKYSGFLAQEVEQAANACGYEFSGITAPKNEHSLYSLSYESFVVPLVKAVQEQQAIIENQHKQLTEQAELFEQQQLVIAQLMELYEDLETRMKSVEHQKTTMK